MKKLSINSYYIANCIYSLKNRLKDTKHKVIITFENSKYCVGLELEGQGSLLNTLKKGIK
jgi:hypothetical protein